LRGKHFDLSYALRLAGEALDGGRHPVLCAHRTGLTTLNPPAGAGDAGGTGGQSLAVLARHRFP